MNWFSSQPRAESWMDRIERLYPIGSEWLYLGTPCVILQHRDWDGFPDLRIQYVDATGLIRECSATANGLRPKEGE